VKVSSKLGLLVAITGPGMLVVIPPTNFKVNDTILQNRSPLVKYFLKQIVIFALGCFFLPHLRAALPAADAAEPSAPLLQLLADGGLNVPLAKPASSPVELVSAKQDYAQLTLDASCVLLTPLQIGQEKFAKGLGMHAHGSVIFTLNTPFVRLLARTGIDENPETEGRGSASFAVKVDGKEVVRTPVVKGGEASQPIDVPLTGAKQVELVVTEGIPDIAYDEADWGDARLVDQAGHVVFLSDALSTGNVLLAKQHGLPTSFVYGGQPSASLLATWPRADKPPVETSDRTVYETTWSEPNNGLVATWRVEVFHHWPAMEFRWIFSNPGKVPTQPLTQVEALDLTSPTQGRPLRVIHSTGGLDGPMTGDRLAFVMRETPLGSLGSLLLSGAGGRSSDRDLPFFVIHAGAPDEGLFVGVGWSGQWQSKIDEAKSGQMHVTVEMPDMNLALPPGERIISPSILLGTYSGPWTTGSNLLRRILYNEYVPLLDGAKPLPPVSWNSWFILGNAISDPILEAQADRAAQAGVEYFCIDAGWFDDGWPRGTGNWTVDKAKFPQGLGPIGDYVTKKGMKLGLWFDPASAEPGTRLAKEHPEWVRENLVDLGNKDARDWLFNMMKGFIDEGHVRWMRWDFNKGPIWVWKGADQPDQQGLTQIRHIMGLYDLLDRLMKAYPDLLIEGCASGGRRIDLETVKRSHTFWKSDSTGEIPVIRFHETGGNVFLPGQLLNTNVDPHELPFDTESVFGGPFGMRCDWTKVDDSSLEQIRQQITLYKQLRPLLNEDYYSLFAQNRETADWTGWQFDSPTQGTGFLVIFRPDNSPYSTAEIALHGLDPQATYTLTCLDGGKEDGQKMTGDQLTREWPLELKAHTSTVYRYDKVK
jgi:alpha-galactosidase